MTQPTAYGWRRPDRVFDAVFASNQGILLGLFVFSAVINILSLTGAIYMLQIYDRVLTSHSIPTLVTLSVLAISLYFFLGVLDVLRGQVLVRLGAKLDRTLIGPAHEALVRLPLGGAPLSQAVSPVQDVDTLQRFTASPVLPAFLDLPFMPLYIAFVFFLHPVLGSIALAGGVLLCAVTFATERFVSGPQAALHGNGTARSELADAHARNAELIHAMGLHAVVHERFVQANDVYLRGSESVRDIASAFGGVSKVVRFVLQSAILGVGAYLTLQGNISAGAIVAASIGTSRALAPVEQVIGQWSFFDSARRSYQRIRELLAAQRPTPVRVDLERACETLSVENVSVTAPGNDSAILSNIGFLLKAGDGVGVVGPSASGKSTLARTLTGVWPCVRGAVRLDGAALEHWDRASLGRNIGYLPQDVALFAGSVRENIARLDPHGDSTAVIAASKAAGVHEMILRLPDGYETIIGHGGMTLSAGQRQRIALARALYGDPFLVVLDEPNSNLDAQGEAALARAVSGVRRRGGIVVVIAHRPSVLSAVNKVCVLASGRVATFGPRDEVLSQSGNDGSPGPGVTVLGRSVREPLADGPRHVDSEDSATAPKKGDVHGRRRAR